MILFMYHGNVLLTKIVNIKKLSVRLQTFRFVDATTVFVHVVLILHENHEMHDQRECTNSLYSRMIS
ncbi:hypothetical protein P8452_48102 [Trifolium repens]|nr:hypothetical protein P8452_48102 [Trifolium repens]